MMTYTTGLWLWWWEARWADRADDQDWPLGWRQRGRRAWGHPLLWPLDSLLGPPLPNYCGTCEKPLVKSDWLRTELQNIWPTRQEGLCGVLELERLEGMAGETGQLQFVLRPRVCLRKNEPSIRENKANISLANSATYVGFTELAQTWTMIRVDNYKQWYTFCSNDSQSILPIAKQFKW